MGFKFSPAHTHWNYFITLEKDLEQLSRYVEIAEPNFGTYSIEIARLLFAAASEVDVVAKLLCTSIQPGSSPEKIRQYHAILEPNVPSLFRMSVQMPRFGTSSIPWDSWTATASPKWWTAYNKVKHQRHDHFDQATLGNAVNALQGLFVLLLYYMSDSSHGDPGSVNPEKSSIRATLTRSNPKPSLFRLESGYHAQAIVV